jgi:thiol-disulfide isomerase/thioredoxin
VEIATSARADAPAAKVQDKIVEYALGRGADASFNAGGYGGAALGDRAFLIRSDRPGVYAAVALSRDLPTTMKSVLGSAMFFPPQIAMRAGHDVEAVIDAFGLGMITGIAPVGFQFLDDEAGRPTEEIEFKGEQGSVIARFSAETALLLSLELSIGDDMRVSYVFDEEIVTPDGAVSFDAGARKEVASFSAIPGGPATVGAPAPDFTLDALDGSPRSLAGARGSPLVIDFWALWCAPCISAIPKLDALAKRFARAAAPVAVWTVAIVESKDEAHALQQIRDVWANKGLSLPVLIDRDGQVAESYGVRSLPTTLLVDERGVVRLIEAGLDPGELERLIPARI